MNRSLQKFSLRALILVVALSSLPCWWIASVRHQYFREQAALDELKRIRPAIAVVYGDVPSLSWVRRCGLSPAWIQRVHILDVSGFSYGTVKVDKFSVPVDPVNFDDDSLAEMMPHILEFSSLREMQLPQTNISDRSAEKLAKLETLKFLNLQNTKMTSDSVRGLEKQLPDTTIPFWH